VRPVKSERKGGVTAPSGAGNAVKKWGRSRLGCGGVVAKQRVKGARGPCEGKKLLPGTKGKTTKRKIKLSRIIRGRVLPANEGTFRERGDGGHVSQMTSKQWSEIGVSKF